MIILVDIGNTNIVVGIEEDGCIKATYRFVTNSTLTEDEYYQRIKDFIGKDNIEGVAVSSVVPALDRVFESLFNKYYGVKTFFIKPGVKSGLKLKIEEPKSLGADLLCDAVGAGQKYGYPVFIVDLGTATKLIIVSQDKEYLGGIIAPGMNGSLKSLIQNAAKLSDTALEKPPSIIGNSTITCIQAGMVYGTASMIDGVIKRSMKELGLSNVKVVLTGGLAPLIYDVLETKVELEENILLEGLSYIYKKNK